MSQRLSGIGFCSVGLILRLLLGDLGKLGRGNAAKVSDVLFLQLLGWVWDQHAQPNEYRRTGSREEKPLLRNLESLRHGL